MTRTGSSIDGWKSGRCKAGGVEIHYQRSGRDLPALIALHGLMCSGACLSPLGGTLRDRFDVVLPDARGHGGSDAPARGYLYTDLAGDVVDLIAALGLNRPVLVGHSMGGMTAAVAATTLGEALAALVLIDPTFISREWQREVYESNITQEHGEALACSKAQLLADAQSRHPHRPIELLSHLVEARHQTTMAAFEVLTPPNPDFQALIQDIRVPTLLVLGGKGVVSLETARQLQELNPLLQYELIPDVGHGIPYDQPEALGAVIRDFLSPTPAGLSEVASAD